MTVAMISKVIFPAIRGRKELTITRINSARIESSWEMLTDIATIVLPRNIKEFNAYSVKSYFQKGDPVEIYLGYDYHLALEFTGFISEISSEFPIKIKCDDYMYLLKKHQVNVSMRSTKLSDLIKMIVPAGIECDVADINIGTKRFPNTTAAKILEELQGINIYSYFVGKKLIVGKIYTDNVPETLEFNFEKNVVDDALQYKNKEDVLVKIKGISTLHNGRKITAEFGDEGGDVQNLSYYNITVQAEVLKLVQADYEKYKVDKLDGTITIFGIPSAAHGMKGKIMSQQFPERNGTYYIKKVVKEFDDSPKYHQTIDLDKKA